MIDRNCIWYHEAWEDDEHGDLVYRGEYCGESVDMLWEEDNPCDNCPNKASR